MTTKLEADPRIDPRIKAALGAFPTRAREDVESRETLLAEASSPEALAAAAALQAYMDTLDTEEIAPSRGLVSETHEFVSSPDGNTIKVLLIRPEQASPRPGVVTVSPIARRTSPMMCTSVMAGTLCSR